MNKKQERTSSILLMCSSIVASAGKSRAFCRVPPATDSEHTASAARAPELAGSLLHGL